MTTDWLDRKLHPANYLNDDDRYIQWEYDVGEPRLGAPAYCWEYFRHIDAEGSKNSTFAEIRKNLKKNYRGHLRESVDGETVIWSLEFASTKEKMAFILQWS